MTASSPASARSISRPRVRAIALILGLIAAAGCRTATPATPVASPGARTAADSLPPALDAIREGDLRADLFALASDTMRGREAGTVDELRGAAWLARRAREAGLEPAGDDGTYFQFWPMRRTTLSPESRVTIGGAPVRMWEEGVLLSPVDADVDAPIVWVGRGRAEDLAGRDIHGQVVAAELSPPEQAPPLGRDLTSRRYAMLAVRERARVLERAGARAVILVSDAVADSEYDNIAAGWARGDYATERGQSDSAARARPPVLWVRRALLDRVRAPGARLVARLTTERAVVPSVNVVARVPGTDPAVRGEYLLYSAHVDGLGVRFPWDGDSIWNGADDNASTSVALLAIGRALVRHPARRSVLLVWHGAEEPGLLGSAWYAAHPTVPRDSIIAVLNGDMIGRGARDTAALLGVEPANRTSSALVAAALAADARVARLTIDSSWDRPGHPENFFHRSDHWSYVRYGIPVIYFSTLLHPDYHTPRDEADRIDYAKLTRMARWMYATGWTVANAAGRPPFEGREGAR